MRLRRLIKRNAALALRHEWSKAAGVSLIILVVWSVFVSAEQAMFAIFDIPPFIDIATAHIYLDDMPNVALPAMAVTLVLGFIYLLAMTPLELGAARWFYYLTDGKALPVSELFDSFTEFRKFSRALWLWIILFLRKAFWSALFLVIPVVMVSLGEYWRVESSRDIDMLIAVVIEVLGSILLVLMGLFLLIWLRRYALVKFVVAADDNISAWKAIKYSVKLAKGRKVELLMLELSLLGWRLLDILLLPKLFTKPYIATIYSLYARYLIELDKMEEAKKETKVEQPSVQPDLEQQNDASEQKSEE